MGGVYVSFNYGESFIRHNVFGRVYAIEYDNKTKNIFYYGGDGLYKSSDNGKTITRIYPKDALLETT